MYRRRREGEKITSGRPAGGAGDKKNAPPRGGQALWRWRAQNNKSHFLRQMDATSGPTATDAGVVEIAPVIQSFEIVSDRISNLEESIGILLAHARHREVRTFGELDHRLLGLPCPVTRYEDETLEQFRGDPPRRLENRAEAKVRALIVEYEGLSNLRVCHNNEMHCRTPCAAGEYLTPCENARVAGRCCTSQSAAMHSTQEWVCEEILTRKFEYARLQSAVLARCVTFLPCFKGQNFSLLISCGIPTDIGDLLSEATGVVLNLATERPHSIAVYDCFPESILDYQNVAAKLYSGNVAHRIAAEAFCRRNRPAIAALDGNLFFSGVVDNLPANWSSA